MPQAKQPPTVDERAETEEVEVLETLEASGLLGTADLTSLDDRLPDHAMLAAESLDLPRLPTDQLAIHDRLGAGGMGQVLRADQLSLAREVAVKRATAESLDDEDPEAAVRRARAALIHEARIIGHLEHPNIIPVHALGKDDEGEVVLVMKRVEGTSWRDTLRAKTATLDENLNTLATVCRAVHYAHHRGVLHRDLKPANVMLGPFGEVYVLDWGLALGFDARAPQALQEPARTTSVRGTPGFMAPEMIQPGATVGAFTDVYLLGACLFVLCTGRTPNAGATVLQALANTLKTPCLEVGDAVAEELQAICRRATARDPQGRYPTAEALAEAIDRYRRRAGARRLCREADRRVQVMRMLPKTAEHDEQAARAFHEARFGFEMALGESPDLEVAQQGLQNATVVMARRELRLGREESAAQVLVGLSEVPPEITRALGTAREERRREQAEAERGHALAVEMDVEVGRGGRVLLVMAWGLLWLIAQAATGAAVRAGHVELTALRMVGSNLALMVAVGVISGLLRKRLLNNRIGRRITALGLVSILGCAAVWALAAWFHLSAPLAMAMAQVVVTLGFAAVAVLDLRAAPAAVLSAVFVLLEALYPDYILELNGMSVAGGFTVWALLTRRSDVLQRAKAAGPPQHKV